MKVLFFAPHSDLWTHAFPEALVAEALLQAGHEVTYVTCGRHIASYCIVMSAHGVQPNAPSEARHHICKTCQARDALLRSGIGLAGPRLSEIAEPGDEIIADEMLAGQTVDELICLERDGVRLGRLALYEFTLRNKRMDRDLDGVAVAEYKVGLRNAIRVWRVARRLLDIHQPERVITYNSLYTVNNVICKLAERRGIATYSVHAGSNISARFQSLMIGRQDNVRYLYHVVDAWPRFAGVPAAPRLMSHVTDHFLELLRGRNVYAYSAASTGTNASIRTRWSIPVGSKVLVAAMSSNDEFLAADLVGAQPQRQTSVFESQAEWIEALLRFVEVRADLFLVVRVHPREFPNKREGRRSEHAAMLEKSLTNLPCNVVVNWPGDELSLYDLVDETSVFLTAWSSVGKEMPLLGLPTVTYAPGTVGYTADLNYVGTDRKAYFEAIDQALNDDWSFERARMTYRWGALEFGHALFDIGDSFKELEQVDYAQVPLARRLIGKLRRTLDPAAKLKADLRLRSPRLAAAGMISRIIEEKAESVLDLLDPATIEQATLEEETAALRHELTRLANALYQTPEARSASRLYPLLTGQTKKA